MMTHTITRVTKNHVSLNMFISTATMLGVSSTSAFHLWTEGRAESLCQVEGGNRNFCIPGRDPGASAVQGHRVWFHSLLHGFTRLVSHGSSLCYDISAVTMAVKGQKQGEVFIKLVGWKEKQTQKMLLGTQSFFQTFFPRPIIYPNILSI